MEENYFITTILTLAGVVTTLALYIRHLHTKYTRDQNENLLKMTDAFVKNAHTSEHLANSIDNLPDKILVSLQKRK